MIDRESLKRAVANLETQMNAIITVMASGRQIAGNSFDYNNLHTTKKHIQDLIAESEMKKVSKKK